MKELKITQGPVRRAQKVVLYGSEGHREVYAGGAVP